MHGRNFRAAYQRLLMTAILSCAQTGFSEAGSIGSCHAMRGWDVALSAARHAVIVQASPQRRAVLSLASGQPIVEFR